jgi:hypothetical protein
MPYGYYQFFRIVGFIGFGVLAYNENRNRHLFLMILCFGVAILLNPILKIHFTRSIWNKIDLILAIALLIWIAIEKKVSSDIPTKTLK